MTFRRGRWWPVMDEQGGDGGAGGAAAAPAAGGDGAAAGAPAAGATGEAGAGDGAAGAAPASGAPGNLVGEAAAAGGEAKPAEGEGAKPAEGDGKPGAETKPPEYADFKLPEGIKLEGEALDGFKQAAAAANLSQEHAQSLLDMHAKALQQSMQQQYDAWHQTQRDWQAEVKADPDFGGAKFEAETIPAIAKAIQTFAPTPEAEKALRQAFSFTGAGNHPEVVRFMARVGKSLMEGGHVGGAPALGDGGKSAAAKLYPNNPSGY